MLWKCVFVFLFMLVIFVRVVVLDIIGIIKVCILDGVFFVIVMDI